MKLSWELEVLSRAINYPNLSVAASQIGLSQPQLSRILKRVEAELGLSLLDRDSKRKVSWRPLAHELVGSYLRLSRQWDSEIQSFSASQTLHILRIGCLEGMSESVVDFIVKLNVSELNIKEIDIDVYDLSDLEREFLAGNLDLIFTSRSPGKKKFSHTLSLGFQKFEDFQGSSDWVVKTPFEWAQHKKKAPIKHVVVTRSLWLKRLFVEKWGASARIPSRLRKMTQTLRDASDPHLISAFVIGAENLPKSFWSKIKKVSL